MGAYGSMAQNLFSQILSHYQQNPTASARLAMIQAHPDYAGRLRYLKQFGGETSKIDAEMRDRALGVGWGSRYRHPNGPPYEQALQFYANYGMMPDAYAYASVPGLGQLLNPNNIGTVGKIGSSGKKLAAYQGPQTGQTRLTPIQQYLAATNQQMRQEREAQPVPQQAQQTQQALPQTTPSFPPGIRTGFPILDSALMGMDAYNSYRKLIGGG